MNIAEIDKKISELELELEKHKGKPRFRGWDVYGKNQTRALELEAEIEELRSQRMEALGKGLSRALKF